MGMKVLIVDDNGIARSILKQLAGQQAGLEIIAECEDATDAFKQIISKQVDLILLDIEMPGMSGIDLVKQLGPNRPLIIFTTSKTERAAEAFDLNVVDFLSKPIYPARFAQAIQKATTVFNSRNQELNLTEDALLFVRDGNTVRRLNLNDILYVEAMGDYVKIFVSERYYAIHSTLKAMEEKLPADRFLRVHRSFIVQVNKIDSFQKGTLSIHGRAVPVADAYRGTLNKRLGI